LRRSRPRGLSYRRDDHVAAAADALLPKLAPLLGEVVALLDEAEQAEGSA